MTALPKNPSDLAAWFAEGVRAELAALEKDGGSQTFEVHSGKLLESRGSNQGIFTFIIADGTRIPEDASGRLKTEDIELSATIIGQQRNIIHVLLEGKAIPNGIHWAKLVIDDTALLRRLAELLEELAKNSSGLSPHAASVFHYTDATTSSIPIPDTNPLIKISGELRSVLEKSCGSSITYKNQHDELILEVEYQPKRVKLPARLDHRSDEASRQALMAMIKTTKYEDWRYEQEYRIMVEFDHSENNPYI